VGDFLLNTIVTLGAGHGGYDFGVLNPFGIAEKDITLEIVRRTKEQLNLTYGFDVLPVRNDDSYVSTEQRAQLAAMWGSSCHIELHMSRYNGSSSFVNLQYCNEDNAIAAQELCTSLATTLDIPVAGCMPHLDSTKLFTSNVENYSNILTLLKNSGLKKTFYIQCGCLDDTKTAQKLTQTSFIVKIADNLATFICGLFKKDYKVLAQKGSRELVFKPYESVLSLKRGLFIVRIGAGNEFTAIKNIHGGIFTGCFGFKNGWYKISQVNEEYISAITIQNILNFPQKPVETAPVSIEKTKDGLFYIREQPKISADVIGILQGGQEYVTTRQNGWRLVSLNEQLGYVSKAAWED
jgi:N-acetylmuramoyl-L-alanine amidase